MGLGERLQQIRDRRPKNGKRIRRGISRATEEAKFKG